jgi:hypothetical protein
MPPSKTLPWFAALVVFTSIAQAQPAPAPSHKTGTKTDPADEEDTQPVMLQSRMSNRRIGAIVAGGASLVAFGVAFAFDRSARSSYNDSQTDRDPARQARLIGDFNTKRFTADGFAVLGLGAAVTATYLWITGANKLSDYTRVAPVVTRSELGVAFERRF